MSFTHAAAFNVVPLLGRLVLGAAFTSFGWSQMMGTPVTFRGAEAQMLRELGIGGGTDAAPLRMPMQVAITMWEEAGNDGAAPDTAAPAATATGDDVEARPLHRTTVLLARNGRCPRPAAFAWALAATELGAGLFVLLGFFSRLGALGLATAMGLAFYMTSWGALADQGASALLADGFDRTLAQLASCALALGIALTGGGALSLDRTFLRRSEKRGPIISSSDEDE
jgi:uncharacterized membrane protein YphA (DoxX/SURF4 family)